ncbi:hypothetical protein MKX03_017268, partial [Papaver bracteatum]
GMYEMKEEPLPLRMLNHLNTVKLKEIVQENNELFFIFEYMGIEHWKSCCSPHHTLLQLNEMVEGQLLKVVVVWTELAVVTGCLERESMSSIKRSW